jgi:hypothetical protein
MNLDRADPQASRQYSQHIIWLHAHLQKRFTLPDQLSDHNTVSDLHQYFTSPGLDPAPQSETPTCPERSPAVLTTTRLFHIRIGYLPRLYDALSLLRRFGATPVASGNLSLPLGLLLLRLGAVVACLTDRPPLFLLCRPFISAAATA